MNQSEFEFEAYLGFFASLRKTGGAFFVEGGQAVNYWAEYVGARSQNNPLRFLRPFTSKDCDVWVSHGTWESIKKLAGVDLLKGNSPADGQLGILKLSGNPPLIVDLMSNVYGLPVEEYPRLLDRALDDGLVKVLDPLNLFRSKCHCLLGLDQFGRQDERHVRMLALILPEYLGFQIQDVESGALSDRALLKEIKLLQKILRTGVCRRALASISVDPETLIPWETLRASSSDRLLQITELRRFPKK